MITSVSGSDIMYMYILHDYSFIFTYYSDIYIYIYF